MSNLSELLPTGGGQNAVDFVASGNLASGQAVVLKADGTVEAITAVAQGVGAESVFESATSNYGVATYDSTNNKVVIAYQDSGNSSYGTAVVGTVSGTSISFGTPVVFESGTVQYISATYDSANGKVVIAYSDVTNSYYGTAVVGTVSGTSISFGSPVVFLSGYTFYTSAVYDSTSNKTVIPYRDSITTNYGTAIVGTVSGTSISFGTPVVFESAVSAHIAATYDSSNNKVVIAYTDGGNSSYGTAIVGTVSGTSISFGTAVVFEAAIVNTTTATFDSNSNKIVLTYGDGGNSYYGTAIVGTVSGTSISFGTAVVFNAANTQTYTSATFDSTNNKVVIAYTNTTNSSHGAAIAGTVSGTSISFGATTVTNAAVTYYNAATYDSTNNKVVIGYKDAGNSSYGTAVVFTVGSSNNTDFIGITSEAISSAATGPVNVYGGINAVQTGLTIASDYYVQADGSLAAGVTFIPFDIGSASLTSSFSVASQETGPTDFAFNTDGTKMYVVGYNNDTVYQYSLSTAFSVATASYDSVSFSVASQAPRPMGMTFNNDGTKMYIVCRDNDSVYQYSLSSGFDLSTASYDSVSFSVASQDNLPNSIRFNADGSKMYILGAQYEYIFQYGLSSVFDLSTASYDSVYYDFNAQGTDGSGLAFSPDGTRMFVVTDSNNTVFQYSLSSGYDLSTVSYDSKSLTPSDTNPSDVRLNPDGSKIFIIGRSEDKVFEYATTQTTFVTTVKAGQAVSATTINMKDLT
jgi:hypothetical protein